MSVEHVTYLDSSAISATWRCASGRTTCSCWAGPAIRKSAGSGSGN